MIPLKVSELIASTNGILLKGNLEDEVKSISLDTRKIKVGDFFIPIKGENFDGHDYISKAIEQGACGCFMSDEKKVEDNQIVIKVGDTIKALQDVAVYYREKFDIPVVGVTGSSGKTSTKEMITGVLLKKFDVLKTKGNLNNHIGLPLSILELSDKHQAAVFEMGMSGLGEISLLSKIAKPDIAVITNVGYAHIGKLGSKENILRAKSEIFDGMDEDGLAILNGDDLLLNSLKGKINQSITYFGIKENVELRAYNIRTDERLNTSFKVLINEQEVKFTMPVPGIFNVYNALAAIAVGLKFRVSTDKIIEAIGEYRPQSMRANILELGENIKVINDAYNANPHSMQEALNSMKDIPGNRKIAVLGDMLELGEWTRQAHLDIGKSVVENEINYLITLGENSRYIAEGAILAGMSPRRISSFNSLDETSQHLLGIIKSEDVILVKGSRGMKMEGVVEKINEVKQ